MDEFCHVKSETGKPCDFACLSNSCIRSCSFLFRHSVCFCLASFAFNLCTSFFKHLMYSTDDFNMVPLLGRTSRTISKYGSLFFGKRVPNSLIRSFILNLRRLSTERKIFVLYIASAVKTFGVTSFFKKVYQHMCQSVSIGSLLISKL